jgi:hypothetical protein
LALPAHEGRRLQREVVDPRVQGLQRREARRQIRSEELEDPLGTEEVFQAALAHVAQLRVVRKLVAGQRSGGVREKGLAAVPGGEQAGHTVDGRTEVVAAALLGGPGVKRHARSDHAALLPFLGVKRALASEGGFQGVGGRGEGCAEGVAHRLEDVASVPLYRGPQNLVVAGESGLHGYRVALPEASRALNVRKQKRHSAGWWPP